MNFKRPKFWEEKGLLPLFLFPFSMVYNFILKIRQLFSTEKSYSIPIICVGNIYLGGTGKTPVSIQICQKLKERKFNPVLIKKYYNKHFDEHELIKNNDINLILEKNRDRCINQAINEGYNLVVMDDGFQDLSIKKDLNIVCFNSKQLIGNGFLLPAGPLRQSMKQIKYTNIVIINGQRNEEFENKIYEQNNDAKIFYSKYNLKDIKNLNDLNLLAIVGIGEPINFFNLLRENNLNVAHEMSFPDHYNFKREDIEEITKIAVEKNYQIVTTEKDFFRLKKFNIENLISLKVSLVIENEEKLLNLILKHCKK